jgi:ligand-binding sensor domain-containing protein/DNA-binding CsgD family transcriptional regulator
LKQLYYIYTTSDTEIDNFFYKKCNFLVSRFFFIFCLSIVSGYINAQEIIHNFTRLDYSGGSQNWAFEKDRMGRIYVANNEGLLVCNGTKWSIYSTPNKTIVRSIAFGNDGKLYVGGQDEIGFFEPNTKGVLEYNSLLSLINVKDNQFEDVWQIVALENEVYFRTTHKLFVLKDKQIKTYSTSSKWDFIGKHNKTMLAYDNEKGLLEFKNGQFIPFIGKESLKNNFLITSITAYKSGSILTTNSNGLFKITNNKIEPFVLKGNATYNSQHFTCALQMSGGNLLLGTYNDGLYLVDTNGIVKSTFTKNEGLNSSNIKCIEKDSYNNYWMGLEDGISILNMDNPITHIHPKIFNGAAGYSVTQTESIIYFAMANGIYTMPKTASFNNGLSNIKKIANGLTWKISNINGNLLVGNDEGFAEIKNEKLEKIETKTGFWAFKQLGSRIENETNFAAGNYLGICFYKKTSSGFIKSTDLNNIKISARYVEYDSLNNVIWISHPYRGVFTISLINNKLTQYTTKDGLPSNLNNHVFSLKNKIVFATEKGIFNYNNISKKFEVHNEYGTILSDKSVRYLQEDGAGNIWFVHEKNIGLIRAKSRDIVYFNELQQQILSGFENITVLNKDEVLVGAQHGFYLVNLNKYLNHTKELKLLLTKVTAANFKDSTVFGGFSNAIDKNEYKISRKWNSFYFEFSAPFSENLSNIKYSYRLKGYEDDWSNWSSKTEKDYTNLPAGSYVFEVKAQNNLNQQSNIAAHKFEILPAWYGTIWFKLLVLLLIGYVIYKIHKYQERRVIKKQEAKLLKERKQSEEKQLMLTYQHQLEIERGEKEIAQLKNETLEAELASTAMNLVHKKEFILRIKDEISKLNKLGKETIESGELKKILKRLTAEDNLDEEWDQFSLHFDKVHGNFLNSVKNKYPDLKAHELKLCAYMRLNLSSKEIAQLMSISVRGVEISRYRLRKKLQVPAKEDLFKFLLNLDY